MTVLAILLAASLQVSPEPISPTRAWEDAYTALLATPAEDRPYTRFLTLRTYPVARRADVLDALAYQANAISWSQEFTQPQLVFDSDHLVKMDLRWFRWDRIFRSRRLANLESKGVRFGLKDAEDRRTFLDVWERLGKFDVVYRVTSTNGLFRGWINPWNEAHARKLSYSAHLLMDVDFFLAFTSIERGDGVNQGFFDGTYSDFLMLPRKEDDLFTVLGSDRKFAESEQFKRGGAALQSIVARNNRELVMFPSQTGQSHRFLWFSRDTLSDVDVNGIRKSLQKNFLDTLHKDAGEAVFTIPNGLIGYWLGNAAGDQAREVPINIAQFEKSMSGNRIQKDAVVRNAVSCVECHDAGVNPFDDFVRKAMKFKEDGGQLEILTQDRRRLVELQEALRSYYASNLPQIIQDQQANFKQNILAVNKMDAGHNAANYCKLVWDYFDPVDLDRAAIEWGIDREHAKAFVRDARKQVNGVEQGEDLVNLLLDGKVSRRQFRDSFDDAMQGQRYDWEPYLQAPASPR